MSRRERESYLAGGSDDLATKAKHALKLVAELEAKLKTSKDRIISLQGEDGKL